MKRFLIVCAMALAATVICESRVMAWSNFYLNNNFSVGYQSGGNRFLWGLWSGGAYPAVSTPCGYATYPPPQPQYHPWLNHRMGQQNPYPMPYPCPSGYPCSMQGYGAPPSMPYAYMPPNYGGMPPMQPNYGYAYGYGYPAMNGYWPQPLPQYPQMMPLQPLPQQNIPQQALQMPQGYPMGQPVSLPQQGYPLAQPMGMPHGGYPMYMMPPPMMYYGQPMPVPPMPTMPQAAEGQPSNAQQIGYQWDNPYSGTAPSYWGN